MLAPPTLLVSESACRVYKAFPLAGLRDDQRRRIDDEAAMALAWSSDPGVVRTYGHHVLPEADVQVVEMEYMSGGSLADHITTRGDVDKTSAGRYVRWIVELSATVSRLHAAGVIHRDLKPANVLLDSASDRPVLADFGVARPVVREAPLTSAAWSVGTDRYMAPEQRGGEASRASDQYALAVLAGELLGDRISASVREVLRIATSHEEAARYHDVETFAARLARAARLSARHPLEWIQALNPTRRGVVARLVWFLAGGWFAIVAAVAFVLTETSMPTLVVLIAVALVGIGHVPLWFLRRRLLPAGRRRRLRDGGMMPAVLTLLVAVSLGDDFLVAAAGGTSDSEGLMNGTVGLVLAPVLVEGLLRLFGARAPQSSLDRPLRFLARRRRTARGRALSLMAVVALLGAYVASLGVVFADAPGTRRLTLAPPDVERAFVVVDQHRRALLAGDVRDACASVVPRGRERCRAAGAVLTRRAREDVREARVADAPLVSGVTAPRVYGFYLASEPGAERYNLVASGVAGRDHRYPSQWIVRRQTSAYVNYTVQYGRQKSLYLVDPERRSAVVVAIADCTGVAPKKPCQLIVDALPTS